MNDASRTFPLQERQRDYLGDVVYEVWRAGGNPDAVDYDRVQDYWYDGISEDGAAGRELHIQHQRAEAPDACSD